MKCSIGYMSNWMSADVYSRKLCLKWAQNFQLYHRTLKVFVVEVNSMLGISNVQLIQLDLNIWNVQLDVCWHIHKEALFKMGTKFSIVSQNFKGACGQSEFSVGHFQCSINIIGFGHMKCLIGCLLMYTQGSFI